MKRPMLYITFVYILSIVIGQYPVSIRDIVLFVMFSIILGAGLYLLKTTRKLTAIIIPIVAIIGLFNMQAAVGADKYGLGGKEVSITASVLDKGNNNIILHKVLIDGDEFPGKLDWYNKACDNLEIGDIVMMNCRLITPKQKTNPMDFNELVYCKTKGIEYRIYAENYEVTGKSFDLVYYKNKIRRKLCEIYDYALPIKEAGIIKAIILGEKEGLRVELKELYQSAGIYHIIAISGLHISIITLILSAIFKRINEKRRNIAIILLAWIYCFFVGASASTVRACLMASIFFLASVFDREYDFISSVLLSAFIILVVNPYYLFDIGFLYSFSAVSGIGMFFEFAPDKIKDDKLLSAVGVSFSVALFTKPITIQAFNYLCTTDVILNIIVVPLVSIVVVGGLIVGVAGLVSFELARFLSGAVFAALKSIEIMAESFAILPFSVIKMCNLSQMQIALIYILAVSVMLSIKYRQVLLVSAFCLAFLVNKAFYPDTQLLFASVGQGDCVMADSGERLALFDGGSTTEDYIGEGVLLPYLDYRGEDKFDYIFLTHTDMDHISGVLEIMDRGVIGEIYASPVEFARANFNELAACASRNNIPLKVVNQGDSFTLSDNCYVECVYLARNSAVYRVVFNGRSALITGDISSEDEIEMLANGIDLGADVLKVAHHGSKYSSCLEFLEKVNSSLAIISVGKYNQYGHPAEETLERLDGIPTVQTALDGAVMVESSHNKLWYKTMEESNEGN